MRKIAAILFCALMLSLTGTAAHAKSANAVTNSDYFAVTLPVDFYIEKKSPVEDFKIYTIYKGSLPYLYIYVGNHPSYPKRKASDGEYIVELDIPPLKMLSEWKRESLVHRELLATIGRASGWPSTLHAWTGVLSERDIIIADQILSSLKVKPDN